MLDAVQEYVDNQSLLLCQLVFSLLVFDGGIY